jgi:hypothetical protein
MKIMPAGHRPVMNFASWVAPETMSMCGRPSRSAAAATAATIAALNGAGQELPDQILAGVSVASGLDHGRRHRTKTTAVDGPEQEAIRNSFASNRASRRLEVTTVL